MHYQATGEWLTSFTDYSLSPYVYIHQTSPRAVWIQMDIALGSIDGTATSIIFLALAFTQKKLKTKFTFFLLHTIQNEKPTTKVFINGHCLSKNEKKKLLTVQKNIKTIFVLFVIFFCLFGNSYFLVNAWLNDVYTPSASSALFFLFLFPLYFFYLAYGKYYI